VSDEWALVLVDMTLCFVVAVALCLGWTLVVVGLVSAGNMVVWLPILH
jgi:hypothetical protein